MPRWSCHECLARGCAGHSGRRPIDTVTAGPVDANRDFICVGRSEDLARFLTEYDLEQEDVQGLVEVRIPPGAGGRPAHERFRGNALCVFSQAPFTASRMHLAT
jgi:hypothetical protein